MSSQRNHTLNGLTAYINAGGRGTRLRSVFPLEEKRGISKALLPIGQPPISLIEHQINKLHRACLPTIVVGVGDHDNVALHVGRLPVRHDNVHPLQYSQQLGTAGDLLRSLRDNPHLFSEHVLIANVDTILDLDESKFLAFHCDHGGDMSIALTRNQGVPNQGAYHVGKSSKVLHCSETTGQLPAEFNLADVAYRASSTGALIVKRDVLDKLPWQPSDGPLSIYGEVVSDIVEGGSAFAYDNGGRFFLDIGTVDSWNRVQSDPDVEQHIIRRPQ